MSDAAIDTIDDMLVRLLSLRAIFAGQVVETTQQPTPPERHAVVLERVLAMNPPGSLPNERLRAIYIAIFNQFLGFQRDILNDSPV